MSTCAIKVRVKNSNGELVESRLFNDLLHYTKNNREKSKEYYAIGTDRQFVEAIEDKAEFDENGEITFETLRSNTDLDINEDELLSELNKEIKSGTYSYSEAILKLQNFNRNSQFNKKYLATLSEAQGKYVLSIVPRNPKNENALADIIKNRSIQDRIIYYLNRAGVSVSFLEKDERVKGRYSTINAEKTATNFYNLIKIAKGEKIEETLAEEAGHFAIGALGNSPLVTRLQALLTPEIQEKLFGSDKDKLMGINSAREAAGMLVGRALIGNIDKLTTFGKIVERLKSLIKRVFSTISGNDVLNATEEAKHIADKIAAGFMSHEFTGTVEQALETKETLYNAKPSYNVQVYKDTVERLRKTVTALKGITNDAFAKHFERILGQVESGRSRIVLNPSTFADSVSLEGITEAVASFADMVGPGKEIDTLLKSIDFENGISFMASTPVNGRKLRQVRTFLKNGKILEALISDSIKIIAGKQSLVGDIENVNTLDELGNATSMNLKELLKDLRDANSVLEAELRTKEVQFFTRFCEHFLGKKYIERSSRLLFKRDESKKFSFTLVREESKKISVEDALNYLENDIDFFERFLGSMSNNPDIIGQIVDRVVKESNKAADTYTLQHRDALRILKEQLKNIGITDTSILYERDRTGKLSGNIISPTNWGNYELDFAEFKKAAEQQFKEETPDLEVLTDFEKGIKWQLWFGPKIKAWHKEHSTFNSELNRYVPALSTDKIVKRYTYDNSEFTDLMKKYDGLQVWYNNFMELKRELDSRLPENSTFAVRMPQFKGTYMNKVQNRRYFDNVLTAHRSALRRELSDTFCETSEDTDFGSNNTYNKKEEGSLFCSKLDFEKEKINRLPIYGINKLEDMNDLSTDLFHSMLAYSSMANTYAVMNLVVDTLEVGTEVLHERKVGPNRLTESERKGAKSNAFNRYLKFLDKQVYGIGSTKHKFGKIVWEKITAASSSLASRYFLGGNVVGGMANTFTGFTEIFKEMLSEEHFSYKDWKKAHKYYFSSFVENWANYGKLVKDNKVSLLMEKWNAYGSGKQDFKTWHTSHNRIYNMFSQSIFLPYKSGDHYMQAISYLAVANKTKVYDEDGNSKSLFEAYEVVDIDSKNPKAGKKVELKKYRFTSKQGGKQYNIIQSILSKIENAGSSSVLLSSPINLTTEESEYLAKHNLDINNREDTVRQLQYNANNLIWSDSAESKFMDLCREINNRMHGIYNNQDKVAFQQSWYGNALLAMRGYALGMIERRFSSNHYSLALGHDVEGSVITSLKALVKLAEASKVDSRGFLNTIKAIALPFGRNSAKTFYQMGFSANQIRNMRRSFGDYAIILLLTLLKFATAQDEDDDEEDVNIVPGITYYFTNRLLREQSAFNMPFGAYEESTSLLDLVPSGVSALFDIGKLTKEGLGAPFADKDNSTYFYQQDKEDRYEQGDTKFKVHFFRMFPYLRSIYTFQQPYEASESYEYGRRLKQR